MTHSCDFVAPIRRSKEVKAVCAALRALVERGALRGFQEGKLRVGRMPLDIEWPDGRVSRLRIDIEAATLTFTGLLEAGAGSALFRDLKALVRTAQAPARDPVRLDVGRVDAIRVDPGRAMLRMTEQGGAVSLAIIVTRGEYEYCTRRLIELAREALALALEPMPLAQSYSPALANQ
ncbi:hypothetical protein JM946_25565 [Steroidobacter sp. S1-65]|uniref:Uncharacterized protein n=1 Tax=Steroidobacter gossypii TaxID=2805490 RepID=A0ABS1X4G1_9GAMM|nr:hypothetical protein [Steroidobacter gossypii]MBM0108114.1 hypothetical protein [Steroidobacter gossypii]